MDKYKIKGKIIELHNILFSKTTEIDYEMSRLILLENMPDTKYGEYVLAEGYHCSCYGFDETDWDCMVVTDEELKKILKGKQYGLRKDLKEFYKEYVGNYNE